MSDIATKLAELKQLRNDIRAAIENKGANLPIGSPMANYATAIETIQAKMPIIVLDNTNVGPVSGTAARIDPDLEGLAIITSEINNFRYLFKNSKIQSVVNLALGVTDMGYMFYDSKATTLDLSSFDTSSVTTMSTMFSNSQATTLDLSSFDTSNVTDMRYMFYNSQATTLDLSSFDTSNVTNMISMFRDSQATTLDLSSFDTSNVTYMMYMFYDSRAITLDLSSFDTSNVTNMISMFSNSKATTGYARTQADADKFNASSGKPAGLTFVVK